MKRIISLCCVGAFLLGLGLAGCTRAKPESPSMVAAAAATATPAAVPPSATPTHVVTQQPPPTGIPLTPGPTIISVAQTTPTPLSQPAVPGPTAAPTALPSTGQFEYTVQWGDTLFSLAQRFNTTVDAIVRLNGLSDSNQIRAGQVLRVSGTPAPSPGPSSEYIVQAGDTMYSIARRYNTTVEAIARLNGLVNPWYIRVGQRLAIPQGTGSTQTGADTYVVQAGDTLYGIAAKFGKNAWDIIVANNLTDPYWLLVGQVLTIP
ncbi:MAG: LysM peptidoglycan-binding domain-containing protein [Chloroflexi bacterium]|nr:LysM peptidoglycan-binding domain-containing protein [Chloroflexota bacterium]